MEWGRTFDLIDKDAQGYLSVRASGVGDVMLCVSVERVSDLELRVPREVVRELAAALLHAVDGQEK